MTVGFVWDTERHCIVDGEYKVLEDGTILLDITPEPRPPGVLRVWKHLRPPKYKVIEEKKT